MLAMTETSDITDAKTIPSRPGRPRVADPRMWKKTAMVTESEAAACDRLIQQYSSQHNKRLTRSDVVRLGTLALITERNVMRQVDTTKSWTRADTTRTVRIAGVFTQEEFQRVIHYSTRNNVTFSTLLREGMLAVLTGYFQLENLLNPILLDPSLAEDDKGGT